MRVEEHAKVREIFIRRLFTKPSMPRIQPSAESSRINALLYSRGLAAIRHAPRVFKMRTLATLQVRAGGELCLRPALLRDLAGTAQVLCCALVVDEEFPVLAEAVGFISGDGDHVEDVVGLVEDCVHLL